MIKREFPGSTIRLLAVDDHPLLRDGIASVIEGQPDMQLVAEAANGIDATVAIRRAWPEALIVVLPTCKGDVQARRALEAGAAGYLLKRRELVDTIRSVRSGKRSVPMEIALGSSNKRVGLTLSVTEDTVKAHMKAILHKLGASDRTHAVTLALRRGIIESACMTRPPVGTLRARRPWNGDGGASNLASRASAAQAS